LKNSLDTAREEGELKGEAKGKIEGKIEVAQVLIAMGDDDQKIVRVTGLSIDEIGNLRKNVG
jgi:predicted transposase/invertase (TIGR01784 family)